MHTSRSTRFACSGLLNTSGMRFSATCGSTVGVRGQKKVLPFLHQAKVGMHGTMYIPVAHLLLSASNCSFKLTLAPSAYGTAC